MPVGAVRLTERFGLDRAVSDEALRDALDLIAAELDRLDDRPAPDVLLGMGGALTNLAAVEQGLAVYDPDVVHGTRLDRAAIDRQIELYRTRERRRAARHRRPAAQPRRGHPRGRVRRARGAGQARVRLARGERPRPAPPADRRPLRPRASGRLRRDPRRALPRPRAGCSRGRGPRRGARRTPSLASTLATAGFTRARPQPDARALGEVEDLRERRRALGIDEVHALHVQEHGAQRRVGILHERADALVERLGGGEEQAAVESHHGEAGERLVARVLARVAEDVGPGLPAQQRHLRRGRDVDEPDRARARCR